MSVLINFKICDNARECYGIEFCPTKAFYWDKKNKTIAVDNSNCNDCGICEKKCEVGAVRVARTKEEYEKIKKEIDEDPRKASDLFVDRYGAQPIHGAFIVPEKDFNLHVVESSKLTVVEMFSQESIKCLLRSIPVKQLFKGIDIKYRKMEAADSLLRKYGVKKLPALLFFRDGKMLGKVEGYFESKEIAELKERISKILGRAKA